jgi:hypothetical protein
MAHVMHDEVGYMCICHVRGWRMACSEAGNW